MTEETLNDVLAKMKKLKELDIDDELDIYLESFPDPHFVVRSKIIDFSENKNTKTK